MAPQTPKPGPKAPGGKPAPNGPTAPGPSGRPPKPPKDPKAEKLKIKQNLIQAIATQQNINKLERYNMVDEIKAALTVGNLTDYLAQLMTGFDRTAHTKSDAQNKGKSDPRRPKFKPLNRRRRKPRGAK